MCPSPGVTFLSRDHIPRVLHSQSDHTDSCMSGSVAGKARVLSLDEYRQETTHADTDFFCRAYYHSATGMVRAMTAPLRPGNFMIHDPHPVPSFVALPIVPSPLA